MHIKKPAPLREALYCAASYGWAVYPASKNKRPRTPKGHNDASTDPERIRSMWNEYGGALVGIRTGSISNLAVLDIDRQHNGGAWWQENRHRLPPTRTHRSRSGGLHLFFLHRPGLRNSTAQIAAGIDVRAEGGSIIYWPSIGLPVLCEAPLVAWPEWLRPPPPAPPPRLNTLTGQRPAVHIEAQLTGLIRAVASKAEGQRNASLFWAASRVAEMIMAGELSQPHAEAVLIEAALYAGLDDTEARRTIESAFTRRFA